ncbi:hypothetical protein YASMINEVIRUS_1295 [Yasminevirus sp. GU-2018]|uniref:Uncharacterized protein n=1 Tax=Yasminevirus sp. GU-2018 TaxID=2420051 RepID=A0A5K0UB44_9VIRU|nr:hypothetical protein YASMINEVIRUS_1295 [Yasminevirus sp. GU-2018]
MLLKIPHLYTALFILLILCCTSYMFSDRTKRRSISHEGVKKQNELDNDVYDDEEGAQNAKFKKINYKNKDSPSENEDDDDSNIDSDVNNDVKDNIDENDKADTDADLDPVSDQVPVPDPVQEKGKFRDTDSIRSTTASTVLPQFRCSVQQLQNADYVLKMLEESGLELPLRVRPAHDILRPITPDGADTVVKSKKALVALCKNISTNYDLPYGAVVQEDKRSSDTGTYEYILSCTDGVVDKFYVVNREIDPTKKNGKVVQQISMKNLSDQNKKILRKILYEQHKKHGSINMTVDVGFLCKNPQLPLSDDDTFCVVGVCIEFNKQNVRKKVSYPYAGKIEF